VPAVEVKDLRKEFRRRDRKAGRFARRRRMPALQGVTFTIARGECVAILGQNGSGKSTLVRLLSTLLINDGGEARIFGHDAFHDTKIIRRLVNRVSVEASFFKKMSASENLSYAARFYGMPPSVTRTAIPEILEKVGFPADRRSESMENLSRGMQQKVALARALLTSPVLLLLDEPTTGLDPAGMRDMRDLVKRLAAEGITILLSSHILAEVEELCNRVAIIRRGSIIYEGRLDELLSSAGGGYRLRSPELERARMLLGAQPGIEALAAVDGHLRFQADDAALSAATIALGRAGIGITELASQTTSLEELFLVMTGGESSDTEAAA
jgi:ABC-2 type transport system ATP-binding protein